MSVEFWENEEQRRLDRGAEEAMAEAAGRQFTFTAPMRRVGRDNEEIVVEESAVWELTDLFCPRCGVRSIFHEVDEHGVFLCSSCDHQWGADSFHSQDILRSGGEDWQRYAIEQKAFLEKAWLDCQKITHIDRESTDGGWHHFSHVIAYPMGDTILHESWFLQPYFCLNCGVQAVFQEGATLLCVACEHQCQTYNAVPVSIYEGAEDYRKAWLAARTAFLQKVVSKRAATKFQTPRYEFMNKEALKWLETFMATNPKTPHTPFLERTIWEVRRLAALYEAQRAIIGLLFMGCETMTKTFSAHPSEDTERYREEHNAISIARGALGQARQVMPRMPDPGYERAEILREANAYLGASYHLLHGLAHPGEEYRIDRAMERFEELIERINARLQRDRLPEDLK